MYTGLCFNYWEMSKDYLRATANERHSPNGAPLDFGAIDAPFALAAGSCKQLEFDSGLITWIQQTTWRGR